MGDVSIRLVGSGDPDLLKLLAVHKDYAMAHTPAGSGHAVAPETAATELLCYWLALKNREAVGCIGLQMLGKDHAELKSLHVLATHREQGIADRLLETLEEEARRSGAQKLSLETGKSEGFAASRHFYARRGFRPCPPFGPYLQDPFSYCMSKKL